MIEHVLDMSEIMTNTVQFRFPPGSPRPSWVEMANFLKELDTDLKLIETTYRTVEDRSLFIKFKSPEAMEDSLRKNAEPRRFAYESGRTVEVRMSIAGVNMRFVRVFDLPPEIPDNDLLLELRRFGKIERIIREKFPTGLGLDHMYNGVRGVYMEVNKNIPPTIIVANRKGRIFYDGLKDTCFLCEEIGHRKDSCPQRENRRKKETKKQVSGGSCSYAGIVSGKEAVSLERASPEVLESEVIEVLEEEEYGDIIEESTEELEAEKQSSVVHGKAVDTEKERKRKEGLEKLEEFAKAIHDAMKNPQACHRRNQFATSGSGSGSGPKIKVARRTRY